MVNVRISVTLVCSVPTPQKVTKKMAVSELGYKKSNRSDIPVLDQWLLSPASWHQYYTTSASSHASERKWKTYKAASLLLGCVLYHRFPILCLCYGLCFINTAWILRKPSFLLTLSLFHFHKTNTEQQDSTYVEEYERFNVFLSVEIAVNNIALKFHNLP